MRSRQITTKNKIPVDIKAKIKMFEFSTSQEAEAFVKGINYVNDSAINLSDIYQQDNKWVVSLIDLNS